MPSEGKTTLALITCISFSIRALAFSLKMRERMPAFTSVNSMKMINEGIFLQEKGIDPYSGRLVHSMPFNIVLEKLFTSDLLKCLVFALLDALTGLLLAYGSKQYLIWKVSLLKPYRLNDTITSYLCRINKTRKLGSSIPIRLLRIWT